MRRTGFRLFVAALLLLGATGSMAQPSAARRHAPGQKGMPAACQQVLDDLKAMDARLDEHVKKMNESQGDARVDAMAAALTELAAEHRTLREHHAGMPCGMGAGGRGGCPMMQR
jgi:Skp family chaperone for outer membrane proteins